MSVLLVSMGTSIRIEELEYHSITNCVQNCTRNTENAPFLVKRHAQSELKLGEICRCLWGGESRDRTELGVEKNTLQVPNPRVFCSIFNMTVGSKTSSLWDWKIQRFPHFLGWSSGINRGRRNLCSERAVHRWMLLERRKQKSHLYRAIFKCLWLLVQYPAPKLGLPQSSHHAGLVAWETFCFQLKIIPR